MARPSVEKTIKKKEQEWECNTAQYSIEDNSESAEPTIYPKHNTRAYYHHGDDDDKPFQHFLEN